jgi:hypothetical protein
LNASVQVASSSVSPRPAAAVPNCFPRGYLAPGETLIYETRPSVLAYISIGSVYLLVGFVVYALFLSELGFGYFASVQLVFLLIFIAVPMVLVLLGALRWARTSFALTDKRAMTSTGLLSRELIEFAHTREHLVRLRQGESGRLFGYGEIVYGRSPTGSKGNGVGVELNGVDWIGVKDPLNTLRFVQATADHLDRQQKVTDSVLREQRMRDAQQRARAALPKRPAGILGPTFAPGKGMRCPHCGTAMPVATGEQFCPNCGAQVA